MSILDRIRGKSGTATVERPETPAGPHMTRQEAEDRMIEIAHRAIPPTATPTHFFIASGNRSVIEAYQSLFRVGAPTYGGSAAVYHADGDTLRARKAEAAGEGLRFDGRRAMGSNAEAVPEVADVLGSLGMESLHGDVFVAYVTVGPGGVDWVREVYTTVMGEAMGQGVLPFRMYETDSADAAAYLLGSFTETSST